MFNKLVTEERLRKLEKAIQRLENTQCCSPQACATINWDYTVENSGDNQSFIITVNTIEIVNAISTQSGTFTVQEGDAIELVIGNDGGFHIYGFSIVGSVDGTIDTGGNSTGHSTSDFVVTCQTYTITGNQ